MCGGGGVLWCGEKFGGEVVGRLRLRLWLSLSGDCSEGLGENWVGEWCAGVVGSWGCMGCVLCASCEVLGGDVW